MKPRTILLLLSFAILCTSAHAGRADDCAAKIEQAQDAGIIRSVWVDSEGTYKGIHLDVDPTVWRDSPHTTKTGLASTASCAIADPNYPVPVFLHAGGKVVAKFWRDKLSYF